MVSAAKRHAALAQMADEGPKIPARRQEECWMVEAKARAWLDGLHPGTLFKFKNCAVVAVRPELNEVAMAAKHPQADGLGVKGEGSVEA
jgi:predicted neuraminidase